jgi:hypothetical protein
MNDDTMRDRVLCYLYGVLTPAEEETFRTELESNTDLARCLAEEEGLHQRLPVGGGVEDLPEGALEESRLLLRAALRRQAQSLSVLERMSRWFADQQQRLAWAGGAVALVLFGAVLGRGMAGQGSVLPTSQLTETLVDVRVLSYDEVSGQVELEVTGLATTRLEGELSDPRIQATLTAAMLGDLEPGPRLLAVDLLRHQTASTEIRHALTEALLDDDNPGVRVAAAEALSGLAADDRVRHALQQALLDDDNPGVRVAAIEGLRDLSDEETRQVFERVSRSESNQYIRAEARRAVDAGRPAPIHL